MAATEEEKLVEKASRLTLLDNESFPQPVNLGFFSPYSHHERVLNQKVAEKISKAITAKDLKHGLVYVGKAVGSHYSKVGFSQQLDERRLAEVEKECGVAFEKTYRTSPFFGAFRAEQIAHDVLTAWQHDRLRCKCGKVNREWYSEAFGYVIAWVNLVHTWMAKEPYNLETQELKVEWEEALCIWRSSQNTQEPLSWPEFFLLGLELHLFPQRSSPPSSSVRIPISASVTDVSNTTTTPTPWSRRKPMNKASPFRPPSLPEAYSSPPGLQSDCPYRHWLFPNATASQRSLSTSQAEKTESLELRNLAGDLRSPDKEHSISVDVDATTKDTITKDQLALAEELTTDEYLTAEEDMVERHDPTNEKASRGNSTTNVIWGSMQEEVPKSVTVARAEEAIAAQEVVAAEGTAEPDVKLIAEDDPIEQEIVVRNITSQYPASQDLLAEGDSADDERSDYQDFFTEGESDDDEGSDYQYTSSTEDDSEPDREWTDEELARHQEELAEEVVQLLREDELADYYGEAIWGTPEESLLGGEPGLIGENKTPPKQEEVVHGATESGGAEGFPREEDAKLEVESKANSDAGPAARWSEDEPQVRPKGSPEVGSNPEDRDEPVEGKNGRFGPSMAHVKRSRWSENDADQEAVNPSYNMHLLPTGADVPSTERPVRSSPYEDVPVPSEGDAERHVPKCSPESPPGFTQPIPAQASSVGIGIFKSSSKTPLRETSVIDEGNDTKKNTAAMLNESTPQTVQAPSVALFGQDGGMTVGSTADPQGSYWDSIRIGQLSEVDGCPIWMLS